MTTTTTPAAAEESSRIVKVGMPDINTALLCDNQVNTAKYSSPLTFFPIAILEQFRRKANVFFLVMIVILVIGEYSTYFESAYSPWTLVGPLSIVIAVSLAQEGYTDYQRHRSDHQSNTHPCTIVVKGDANDGESGDNGRGNGTPSNYNSYDKKPSGDQTTADANDNLNPLSVQDVQRKSLRVGQLVLLRNRDMIPSDIVLLASSGANGGAYVETSGIDGETNLKLRQSAKPKENTLATAVNPNTTKDLSAMFGNISAIDYDGSANSSTLSSSQILDNSLQSPLIASSLSRLPNINHGGNNRRQVSTASAGSKNYPHPHPLSPAQEDQDENEEDEMLPHVKTPPIVSSRRSSDLDLSEIDSTSQPPTPPPGDGAPSKIDMSTITKAIAAAVFATPPRPKSGLDHDNGKGKINHNGSPLAPGIDQCESKSIDMDDVLGSDVNVNVNVNVEEGASVSAGGGDAFQAAKQTTATIANACATTNAGASGSMSMTSPSPSLRNRRSQLRGSSQSCSPDKSRTSLRMSLMPLKPPKPCTESLDEALERVGAFSGLTPHAVNVQTTQPAAGTPDLEQGIAPAAPATDMTKPSRGRKQSHIATVTVEPPNASVHTFSGKLVIPLSGAHVDNDTQPNSVTIPLNAEHLLLRGAVLRNTDWAVGVVVYSGTDTKIVRNSNPARSKLSRLDELVNRTVSIMIVVMFSLVLTLTIGSLVYNAQYFPLGWYLGFKVAANEETGAPSQEPWPYLQGLPPPVWKSEIPNFLQMMVFFTTLLGSFVPLTIYVAIEMTTRLLMVYIYWDKEMYHAETDTPANARSTTITDLGQVRYIFSDKTGTLTQNVMRFQRCSVDGMLFGAPVVTSSTNSATGSHKALDPEESEGIIPSRAFHPLQALLGNCAGVPSPQEEQQQQRLRPASASSLTFNAEMFLRVMAICHTVVVETEDTAQGDEGEEGDEKKESKGETAASELDDKKKNSNNNSSQKVINDEDGAPYGQSYQAESPDEGALVSAASLEYGFQLVGRDTSGVELECSSPSLLSNRSLVEQLKSQQLTPRQLAQQTTARDWNPNHNVDDDIPPGPRHEKWQVLAVNKFDSTRKRMSVLVRSPPELGNLLMVLCKGADSAMMDPTVCEMDGNDADDSHTVATSNTNETSREEEDSMSLLQMEAHLGQFASEGLRTLVLGMRIIPEAWGRAWLTRHEAAASSILARDAKLTQVAMELETKLHIVGLTAIEDKLQEGVPDAIANLAKAGIKLWVLTGDKRETAIEIGYSTKVLTEQMTLTQIVKSDHNENGGSGSHMDPSTAVQTALAKEFLRLIKQGALPEYQTKALDLDDKLQKTNGCRHFLKAFLQILRAICCCPCRVTSAIFSPCLSGGKMNTSSDSDDNTNTKKQNEKQQDDLQLHDHGRRRLVRDRAEMLVRQSVEAELKQRLAISPFTAGGLKRNMSASASHNNGQQDSPFERARFAQASMVKMRESNSSIGGISIGDGNENGNEHGHRISVPTATELRSLALAASTHNPQYQQPHCHKRTDDDLLSLASFVPGNAASPGGHTASSFDRKKRTLLEKWFAVDRASRHGHLGKHVKKEHRVGKTNLIKKIHHDNDDGDSPASASATLDPASSRALIIEGAALHHLLGDAYMSEMLFRVATQCNAVIACRVSPQQKALLVRLVRSHLQPEPITLAIGDGANDVGMIQEAHVGIGISGLEGQQAVNSSDFSIAQFRYLETLLLIHGRWNFIRLSRVVLFTFYKNAILAGLLIAYAGDNLFSGTPLFDQWLVAMFNFVTQIPILLVGFFDCDIASKSYIRQHPELYGSGPDSEDMSVRKVLRWLSLTLVHFLMIYFFSMPLLNYGGTMTSAWQGTMTPNGFRDRNNEWPGDGEGDYKTFGTAVFTVMVFSIAYKALYETKSIFNGTCLPCTCRKNSPDNPGTFWSRIPWTWIGVILGQLAFFIFAAYMYQITATQTMVEEFIGFVGVATHTFGTRAIVWLTVFFVPVLTQALDVSVKMFGNMYYPTQTQIHAERAAMMQHEQKRSAAKQE